MDALQAILLGVLQGLFEWIPISSQGQTMLIMMNWQGISPVDALSLSIFLHLGTAAAVLIRFWNEFLDALRNLDSQMTRILVVSTLSTAASGIPLYLLFKDSFSDGWRATLLIGALLILTGLLLRFKGSGLRSMEDMKTADMVLLGLTQGFSILPGVSRSGTTLTVLLMRNLRQNVALVISFMMSVPAVLAAIVMDRGVAAVPPGWAALAFLASFVTGYLSINLLICFAKRVDFSKFCIALGIMTLAISVLVN